MGPHCSILHFTRRCGKPMRAPARLHGAPCPHRTNTSAVVVSTCMTACIPSAKTPPFCCKVLQPSQLKPLTDVRRKRCICHAQPDNNRTTDEARFSKRQSLPTASRQQILTNCCAVSAAFVAVAAAIRLAAPVTGPYLFQSDQSAVQALLQSTLLFRARLQHSE